MYSCGYHSPMAAKLVSFSSNEANIQRSFITQILVKKIDVRGTLSGQLDLQLDKRL